MKQMTDEKYMNWKQENHITDLRSLDAWLNEGITDGQFFIPLHEDRDSWRLALRFIDEIPVSRTSAEEIMNALNSGNLLIQDDLRFLLQEKFKDLLTARERGEFLDEE